MLKSLKYEKSFLFLWLKFFLSYIIIDVELYVLETNERVIRRED